jgi:hypothetical protein
LREEAEVNPAFSIARAPVGSPSLHSSSEERQEIAKERVMTTTPATDQGQIRALLDGVSQALRAKDAARLMSHYAPDVVQFSLASPSRRT